MLLLRNTFQVTTFYYLSRHKIGNTNMRVTSFKQEFPTHVRFTQSDEILSIDVDKHCTKNIKSFCEIIRRCLKCFYA